VSRLITTDGYCMVKRILVTPSSILLLPYVSIKSCRMLRGPAKDGNILIVTFCDEHSKRLNNGGVFDRVEHILRKVRS
jgi:hypothetical protein